MTLINREDAIKAIKNLCLGDGEIAQYIWSTDAMDAIRGVPTMITGPAMIFKRQDAVREDIKKLRKEIEHRFLAAVGNWEEDVYLNIDEARKVLKYLADDGPRVLAPEEIGDSGSGWMEKWFMGDEEDDDYKALFHVAWAGGFTVELDGSSCPSYGKLDDLADYNRTFGWRVWTEEPTRKLMCDTPWGKA